MPTDLPARTRSTAASELKLLALAALLPWCLSLLLAYHDPAIAQAFLIIGQFR